MEALFVAPKMFSGQMEHAGFGSDSQRALIGLLLLVQLSSQLSSLHAINLDMTNEENDTNLTLNF
jgi:hypothetical protein